MRSSRFLLTAGAGLICLTAAALSNDTLIGSYCGSCRQFIPTGVPHNFGFCLWNPSETPPTHEYVLEYVREPGHLHPEHHHVVFDNDGDLIPEDGWTWADASSGRNYATVRVADGTASRLHPNVVFRDGFLYPAPGYQWRTIPTQDFAVERVNDISLGPEPGSQTSVRPPRQAQLSRAEMQAILTKRAIGKLLRPAKRIPTQRRLQATEIPCPVPASAVLERSFVSSSEFKQSLPAAVRLKPGAWVDGAERLLNEIVSDVKVELEDEAARRLQLLSVKRIADQTDFVFRGLRALDIEILLTGVDKMNLTVDESFGVRTAAGDHVDLESFARRVQLRSSELAVGMVKLQVGQHHETTEAQLRALNGDTSCPLYDKLKWRVHATIERNAEKALAPEIPDFPLEKWFKKPQRRAR